ncbi:MAG: YopT-type cysteine protease domain-containing protein [Geminicoccaceae bacterium]
MEWIKHTHRNPNATHVERLEYLLDHRDSAAATQFLHHETNLPYSNDTDEFIVLSRLIESTCRSSKLRFDYIFYRDNIHEPPGHALFILRFNELENGTYYIFTRGNHKGKTAVAHAIACRINNDNVIWFDSNYGEFVFAKPFLNLFLSEYVKTRNKSTLPLKFILFYSTSVGNQHPIESLESIAEVRAQTSPCGLCTIL